MRACNICGVEMRVLFPLRIGTAVRWACEWCLRDAAKVDEPGRDDSPGSPEDETHWGRDQHHGTRQR